MNRVFVTAECEEVRNFRFWELRYEKHKNQMKGCAVVLKVSDQQILSTGQLSLPSPWSA